MTGLSPSGISVLAQWVEDQGEDGGYKVEFETDYIWEIGGKRRAWWCEVRSVFDRPGARVMGYTIDQAAQNALEVLR